MRRKSSALIAPGLLLLAWAALVALLLTYSPAVAGGAAADLPEGLVQGARVELVFPVPAGPAIIEVRGIRGAWVRAAVVEADWWEWAQGSELWINTGHLLGLRVLATTTRGTDDQRHGP